MGVPPGLQNLAQIENDERKKKLFMGLKLSPKVHLINEAFLKSGANVVKMGAPQ